MGTYSLGGQADSYYEYLIKQHHLLAAGTKQYGKMYAEAMDTARTYLMSEVDVVPGAHLLTFGDNAWETYTPRLDHLTCFAGAMLALGSKLLNRPTDLVNADRVGVCRGSNVERFRLCMYTDLLIFRVPQFTESCVWGYNMTQSGVGPESLTFWGPSDTTSYSKYEDEGRSLNKDTTRVSCCLTTKARALQMDPSLFSAAIPLLASATPTPATRVDVSLRVLCALTTLMMSHLPAETIESVFYMWRITRDKKWQDKVCSCPNSRHHA